MFDLNEAYTLLTQLVAIRSYPGEERASSKPLPIGFNSRGLTAQVALTENGQPNLTVRVENGEGPTYFAKWACRHCACRAGLVVRRSLAGTTRGRPLLRIGRRRHEMWRGRQHVEDGHWHREKEGWRGTVIFSPVTDEGLRWARAGADSGFAVQRHTG